MQSLKICNNFSRSFFGFVLIEKKEKKKFKERVVKTNTDLCMQPPQLHTNKHHATEIITTIAAPSAPAPTAAKAVAMATMTMFNMKKTAVYLHL